MTFYKLVFFLLAFSGIDNVYSSLKEIEDPHKNLKKQEKIFIILKNILFPTDNLPETEEKNRSAEKFYQQCESLINNDSALKKLFQIDFYFSASFLLKKTEYEWATQNIESKENKNDLIKNTFDNAPTIIFNVLNDENKENKEKLNFKHLIELLNTINEMKENQRFFSKDNDEFYHTYQEAEPIDWKKISLK